MCSLPSVISSIQWQAISKIFLWSQFTFHKQKRIADTLLRSNTIFSTTCTDNMVYGTLKSIKKQFGTVNLQFWSQLLCFNYYKPCKSAFYIHVSKIVEQIDNIIYHITLLSCASYANIVYIQIILEKGYQINILTTLKYWYSGRNPAVYLPYAILAICNMQCLPSAIYKQKNPSNEMVCCL